MIGGEPGSSSRSGHSSDSGGTCSKFFVIVVVVVVLVNVIVVSLSLITIGSRQVAVSDPAAAVTAEAAHLIDS